MTDLFKCNFERVERSSKYKHVLLSVIKEPTDCGTGKEAPKVSKDSCQQRSKS